jgi:hypothetical protein
MTARQAAGLVAVLRAAFPGPDFTAASAKLYVRLLTDLPFEATERAVKRLIATSAFLPRVAEIRTAVAAAQAGVPPAEEAWAEVQRAITHYHYRMHHGWEPWLTWSHELVGQAAEAVGGLYALQQTQVDELGVARGQFLRMYEAARRRRIDETNVRMLDTPQRAALPPEGEDRDAD